MTQDMLFDTELLARAAAAATAWQGAPLAYTDDYWTPDQLDAAMERYRAQHGNFGCIPRSHMWSRNLCNPPLILPGHELHLFRADVRCSQPDHDHTASPLPNGIREQVNCPNCHWHRIGPRGLVEAWHDHAMRGWRSLPVLPDQLRDRYDGGHKLAARRLHWVQDNYPAVWQITGAPILTRRDPRGTGSVAQRSPLGGYDLAAPDQP